jgi:hypothetical protein
MARKIGVSNKHVQIDRANTLIVVLVSFAAFITVFSFFSSKALLSQREYQSRIIKEKKVALKQLEKNEKAIGPLTQAYEKFVSQQTNVIGGIAQGIGNNDGDNAKIILDALPSKYDFPAVVSSLEKLLVSVDPKSPAKFLLESIEGTDDEINQQALTANGLLEIPFNVSVTGNYLGTKEAILLFERSIRPFQIDELTLSGSDAGMRLEVSGKTYYQPEKSLQNTTKEVK